MKRNVYKLDEVDCAACSLKIEDAVKKLDGVIECGMNFILLKFIVTFDETIISEEDLEKTILKSLTGVRIITKNGLAYENTIDTREDIKRRLFFGRRR